MKKLLSAILVLTSASLTYGQNDTVTTLLREVSVVGVKQQAESELASVTRIDGSTIDRLNISTMKGVSEIAPNFYLPQYGSRMTSSIYVRGMGTRIDQPVVGLNIDGVPYLNKDAYDFELDDIDRIEVLRGPQSVLNGRNTIGGQINITTLSPWRYRGVRLMAEYGRFNAIKAGVGWYGRISLNAATAVTAHYNGTGGYFRNEYNNARIDKEQSGSARWKLSWHPNTRFSLTNTAAMSLTKQGGYAYESVANHRIAYNDTCYYQRTGVSDAVTIGWGGKRVIVNSVTAFQYINDNMTLDQDFTPADYFTLTQKRHEWALTQDLFTKGHRGNYSWLGGIFGFYKRTNMSAPVTFKETGISQLIEAKPNQLNPDYPIVWDDRNFVLGSDFTQYSRGIALYHRSVYRLSSFTFEGGVRFDYEQSSLSFNSNCNTGYTVMQKHEDGTLTTYRHHDVNIDDQGHLSQSFFQVLPKLTVSWTNNDATVDLYASVAEGYKAGGYNTQMFSDVLQQRIMGFMGIGMTYDIDEIVSYKPEKSWNYEIGAHLKTPNRRLSADIALFMINCTDLQITMFPSGTTTGRITTNAGRSRSMGIELSATWHATDKLTLRADYGYTNATFRKYNNGIADFRGKHVPYAPENTLFLSGEYIFKGASIFGATPSVNVNMRGVGRIQWNETNTLSQPFYCLLGMSVALKNDKWSVRLWGENITNTRYNTFYFVSMSREFVNRAMPWTAGATLRWHF